VVRAQSDSLEAPLIEIISTTTSPKAIGPFSQAIRAGGFVFVSGQLPIDPATGEIVSGDISFQTERVIENLKTVLAAAGSSISKVVKTTIFLQDLGDYSAVNDVYARYFSSAPPARSTVEIARLPRDARIEIELMALA